MSNTRLHLDADTSTKSLFQSLLVHGFDVTRTPNEWIARDANDTEQLLGASAHRRVIFTFNVQDFLILAARYPGHAGILLSAQKPMPILMRSLEKMMQETNAEDWIGQVRWLTDWR